MNLVITENRKRLADTRVAVSLKDVTCTDAFEAVLAPHGMTLLDKGDYFSIGGLPTRSWELNLFEPLRSETQSVSYNAYLAGEEGGGSGNSVGGMSESIVRQERDLMTELQEDLQQLVAQRCEELTSSAGGSSLLSPPGSGGGMAKTAADVPCGYVRLNRAVGVVKIQAPREVLLEADAIIKRTEDIASRRLFVEARVLAVSKVRSFQQGANLAALINIGSNSDIAIGFEGGTSGIGAPTGSISSLLANLTNSGGFVGIQDNSIQGLVTLIETFSTSYQLMQPTLEIMDRQKATLIDGRNDIYFVRESEVIASEGGNIVNTTAQVRYQFEGIQFSITAQIADGDEPHTIALQIPITEIIAERALTQTFASVDFTDLIPIANTRVIDQKVRARDGEIKVVGGLTRTMAVDTESGIPLLRGVPALGKAFNEENVRYEDVEFLVLLKVTRIR